MKKSKLKSLIDFPFVRNVQPRLIADDIFPYIPGDKENMAVWDRMFKQLHDDIKKEFDAKGIPMPGISIDSTSGPITYGVKTVDAEGNVLHSLIPQK